MSKKLRYLLFVLVLTVPLLLAACGGDDDDDDNGGGEGGESISLDQSFTSTDGISVKYPAGWVTEDMDGQVMLASSAEALDAAVGTASPDPAENDPAQAPVSGEIALGVMVYPLAEMGMSEDTTIDAVFEMMVGSMSGEGMETVGDPETLTISGSDARRLTISSEEIGGDGFILAFIDDDNMYVTLIGITATGESGNFDDVVTRIAETVVYSAAPDEPAATVDPDPYTAPAATQSSPD